MAVKKTTMKYCNWRLKGVKSVRKVNGVSSVSTKLIVGRDICVTSRMQRANRPSARDATFFPFLLIGGQVHVSRTPTKPKRLAVPDDADIELVRAVAELDYLISISPIELRDIIMPDLVDMEL